MKTVTLKLTERELWLLKCGFDSSFVDDGDNDSNELSEISGKVTGAWMKAKGSDERPARPA